MRFTIEQRFAAPVEQVARAYADPALYASFDEMHKLSKPEVLDHQVDGDVVRLDVRFRFVGELSSAARAVIDPARLSWIERSTHHLAERRAEFAMLQEHYRDRFRCQGSYRFEPVDDSSCARHGEADLRVKALLVAHAVEGAIVSGLEEHLDDEVPMVEAFLRGGA